MIRQPQGSILAIIFFILIVFTGYYIWNAPDKRSVGSKIGDAIHELPNGADKAARQLESRTPGEKLQDSVGDTVDDLKKTTNQQ